MQVDLYQTFLELYRYNGIHVLSFWDLEKEIEQIDFGFRKKISVRFNYQLLARNLEQYLEPGISYLFEDELHLNYSIFRFSPEQAEEYHCRILCIGPFSFQPVNQVSFLELMEALSIPAIYHQDYLEYLNFIPIVSSSDSWSHMLGFFLAKLYGSPVKFRYINFNEEKWRAFSSNYIDYSIPHEPQIALNAIETRYALENQMMAAVAAGNTDLAYQLHFHFQKCRLLPRVPDPIRDQKNLLFTLNTLLRKAAETGHVHPMHIDNLSRQFAIQIESCLSLQQLDALRTSMIRKYCMLVNNYSRQAYSVIIQTCMDYIDFHYNFPLSLSALAGLCSVSESYLSTLFKKETKMTVTEYINSTRIRQALILLNSSAMSIGEIASQCGFFDANYFSRVFKKQLGLSPKEYRDNLRTA